jgi:hypothetical protein
MALVTIRILDGPDRGKEFNQIATPVTIGREEGSLIQLNDHRVSRHHVKIYENGNAVLATDLQSTNGTKINGESVHVWQLQPGDLITLGQSMLLFGSKTEIAERLAVLKKMDLSAAVPMGTGGDESDFLNQEFRNGGGKNWTQSSRALAQELFGGLETPELSMLRKLPPPTLPSDLPPQQAAQLEAFLQYLHLRLRHLVSTIRSTPALPDEIPTNTRLTISAAQWQNIIDLHARISTYMSSAAMEQFQS